MNTKLALFTFSLIMICANNLFAQEASTSSKDSFLLRITPQATPYAGGGQVLEKTLPDGSTYMEVMPRFPGGELALRNYISQNIRYPKQAEKNKIEGRVIVMFLVTLEGNLEQIRILKSVDPELDNEVIRMIKSMPKWEPGKTITIKNGRETIDKVKTFYTLPVNFKLSSSEKN